MVADIICMGEPLVEFNETRPGLFQQGFGGDTSNCAVAAARQGARVGYLTAVGADAFGDRLLALWQEEGVDTGQVVRDSSHPTGHYFVTHGADGGKRPAQDLVQKFLLFFRMQRNLSAPQRCRRRS